MTDNRDHITRMQGKAPDIIGAVAVVGGGIAGMQSALDLARTGFKVYLVEQNTTIGGVMAQLDKTFPTNDCSTCMISPKLIEVAANPNIDIITGAAVQSLAGEPGHFRLEIELRPRYVEVNICTACGECAKVCPVTLPSPFDEGLGLRRAAYRHFPQAIPSAYAIEKLDRAPCVRACPANLSVQGYVQLIKAGKYPEALALIMERLPLPGSIGRICPHPCENDCRRREIEAPVAICNLKRFVADQVDWSVLPVPERARRDEAVAIVGAGPSGLSCAYHLALKGYRVVVLEAASEAGGWLRYGIPEYRLPRGILRREVDYLKRLGIEFRFQTPIGPGLTVNDLLIRDGFRAVFLGVGCQDSIRLPVPGADAEGVLWGVEYLKEAASTGANPVKGKSTVVVGGGNVAMDVARTARRRGASQVTLICLESRDEMPASPWEVEEAEREGVEIVPRWGVKQISVKGGMVTGLVIKAVDRVFDEQGRFAPTYFEGRTTTRKADVVIMAIGQKANLQFLTPEDGIELTPRGLIKSDPETLATSRKGVFAGGDVVSGPYIAIAAVAAGREAAISVDRYLNDQDLKEDREKLLRPIPKLEGHWSEIPPDAEKQPRAVMSHLPVTEWIKSFQEINLGYGEAAALTEAARCLNCGVCSECMQCLASCQAKAINHNLKPQTRTLEVGAVILTLGFRPFDASRKGEYGYGRYPNVITSLEFERMLSASGPFRGHIQRPADGQEPVKVAWIQCVGSRDPANGQDYCSSVCCMYAIKQAIIAKEHDRRIEPTIFFMDLRAHGKGFDRYDERARSEHGVRFVRSMISRVAENPLTHDLEIHFQDEAGRFQDEIFDLVILSVGVKPHPAGVITARRMNVELDRFGFIQHRPFDPISTSREGVYAAGVFQTPKDIPETVAQASSAACQAQRLLTEARRTLVSDIEYPPERSVTGEEPRIGVFVCHCGINIAGVIDVKEVAAYARTLPHVVYTSDYLFTCSTDSQAKMMQIIDEYRLNRVVVASCSPRTHEPLFQDNLRQAGLNKYLFDMANIRDQCSWVHQQEPQAATAKAKDLVRMSVSRAARLEPLIELPVAVTQKGLVIGGGVAGLTAALALAEQGFPTTLVEKTDSLGGEAARLFFNTRGESVQAFVQELIHRVTNHPHITLLTSAEVSDTRGHIGKFVTRIRVNGQEKEVEHGATIVATGGCEYRPTEYLYGHHPHIWTQREFHGFLGLRDERLNRIDSLVMIQCVGSREPEHPYCSRICCTQAITNSLRFKELNPKAAVYVLYRDIRSFGLNELHYQQARAAGVRFVRFDPAQKPEVNRTGESLRINVLDQNMRTELEIPADAVVLSAAIRPRPESRVLAGALKLPLDQDGFFLEAHVKLRPLDFASSGYFLCGLGHGPKFLEESIAQAQGAASRAATILAQEKMFVGGQVARVDREKCVVCMTCARTCPFGAPKVAEDGFIDIDPAECHGCGNCASACPRRLIQVQHLKDDQILAETMVVCSLDRMIDDLQSEVA
ncbi:FAD-dependent oxidoreductase [Desulfobacca acetoxidans]|uniref:Glutamate synthase (NADPH) n=1 Tax=Desulfobacca acetoxidans (strain ATCC 700848 / DSM 11109 / ASRB2) TaxID=880072 RepID=F2NGT0_DESAR|nr:FAD-dependent oxidoreductase [Desulfobacca acetoxidans]AEB08701.1 Glutamate synthase (NADPH) [Desulfobacca acetoxidans DSM 11109]